MSKAHDRGSLLKKEKTNPHFGGGRTKRGDACEKGISTESFRGEWKKGGGATPPDSR